MGIEWAQRLLDQIAHLPAQQAALMYLGFGALQIIIPIFPGDLMLLLGAGLWSRTGNPWLILAGFYAGIAAASIGVYELGCAVGSGVFSLRWMRRLFPESAQRSVSQWLKARGTAALFCAKFVLGTNILMLLLAGSMHLPRRKAYPPIAAAAAVQNFILFRVGMLAGERWEDLSRVVGQSRTAFAIGALLVFAVIAAASRCIKKRLRRG